MAGRGQSLSVSPTATPSPHSTAEVDAINNNNNNNRNIDPNLSRKSGLVACQLQCKPDTHAKPPSGKRLNSARDQTVTSIPVDTHLSNWLNSYNIDSVSKNLILAEHFTFDDFIYGMEKSDLYRIGLK